MDNEITVVYIIIPVYNAENTIERCLKSVLNQTYDNCFIICVDDASTDSTLKICRKVLQNGSVPYHIIESQKNAGVSAARNKALDYICKNNGYAFFLDSDDEISSSGIMNLIQSVEAKKAEIGVLKITELSPGSIIQEDCNVKSDQAVDYVKLSNSANFLRFHGYVWGCLWPIDFVKDIRFDETIGYMEDNLWIAEVLKYNNIKTYAIIDDSYYYYIIPDSLSRKESRNQRAEQTLIAAMAYEHQEKECITCNTSFLLNRRYFRNCFWGELKVNHFKNCKALIKTYCSCFSRTELIRIILDSSLSLKMKVAEIVMTTPVFEYWIYRIMLR